ncbi:acyltransferase family protein [Colwelliaceae bacterium BS250]
MKYKISVNNLDLLRLLLALSVVFLHLKHLSQSDLSKTLGDFFYHISANAVPSFFIISGFLIYMSYERSSSLRSYLGNRFLRLYPAYVLLILGCTIFLGLVSELALADYYSFATIKYFLYNSLFLNFMSPSLPGVFENHNLTIVNGALWSLKIEVMFYLTVPLLFRVLESKYSLIYMLIIYILSFYYINIIEFISIENSKYLSLTHQLPAQMSYFIAGIFCYKYYSLMVKWKMFIIPISLLGLFFEVVYLQPLLLALLLVIVFIDFRYIISLKKVGDLSYGVYIYHFPLIQLFIYFGVGFTSMAEVLLLFLSVLFISFLSWKFVEKPSLALKRYIRT